jgi:hypothetical protein
MSITMTTEKITPEKFNRAFYPLVRQLSTGKMSRERFEYEWGKLQRGGPYAGFNNDGVRVCNSGAAVSVDSSCSGTAYGGR